MVFELPSLEYEFDALEPVIDAKTMEIHHTKHHAGYVKNLNSALENFKELGDKGVEELLKGLDKLPDEIRTSVRNNAGGHYNHSLFWKMLSNIEENKEFFGRVSENINETFGSLEEFKKKFVDAGMKRFGSGWVWLVSDSKGELSIVSTANQDNPISVGFNPILGVDLWEHAYYLNYQNRRKEYLENIFNIINWKFVNELYEAILNG